MGARIVLALFNYTLFYLNRKTGTGVRVERALEHFRLRPLGHSPEAGGIRTHGDAYLKSTFVSSFSKSTPGQIYIKVGTRKLQEL